LSSPANANKPASVTLWADRINQAYNGELGDETGRKARDRINWMCSQAQGDSVLDIGCSQGITTLLLAREGFKAVGIDISEDAIDYARGEQEKELPSVRERIEFLCTDLAGLDAAREFDTVILGEVLEHQAHTAKFLKTAASHVKAGGTLVVTVPFGLHPFPDHKATIFPRDILTILEGDFSVTAFDVHDGYIRFTGVKDGRASKDSMDLAAKTTEAGSLGVQQKYFDLHARNATVTKKSAEFKKALDERTKELGALTSRHDVLQREHGSLQEKVSGLEAALKAAADTRASVEQEHAQRVERLHGDLATVTGQQDELASKLADALQNQQALQGEHSAQVTALQAELAQATAQRDELEAALAAAQQEKGALETDSAERLASLQAELGQAVGERDALASALAATQQEKAALENDNAERVASLQAELGQATAQRDELAAALATARKASAGRDGDNMAQVARVQADLARAAQKCKELESQLMQVRATEAAAQSSHAAEVSRLKAKLAAFELETARAREAEANAQAAKIASLEKRLERNTELMVRKQAALEMSAMAVRKTLSFQLGNLLINGFKSPRSFVRLPGALMALRSEAKTRRLTRRDKVVESAPSLAVAPAIGEVAEIKFETVVEKFNGGGVPAVMLYFADKKAKPAAMAATFTELARHLQSIFPEKSAEAARQAHALDPQPYRAKWLAFRLFEAGFVAEPAELLAALPGTNAEFSLSEQRRAEEIGALSRLRKAFPVPQTAASPAYAPVAGSLLYVAASALPFHTSGYTVRTHELVRAMAASGLNVTVLTRPGYPWDRSDRKGEPQGEQTTVDGILYLHRQNPSQALPLDMYFDEAANAIAQVAKEKRVAAIHAASNHVNALPALLAARSLGIPFIYEMRGLWELSRASKVPNYETSERFQIGLDLEAFVARNADRVYVISNALGKVIEGWGVDTARIALLPNCVNAETIKQAETNQAAKIADVFTVGYAGAMVGYEGLDVLIEAIAQLKARGQRVNARLMGDGDMRGALEGLVIERGLTDQIQFLGKLSPDEARAQLVKTNAVAIPRKAHHVCEIIPPIKMIEAMALSMPVIVPNLPVFCEEIRDDETGILFKAGDASDLAAALERLIADPQLVADMGERARQYASTERVWREFAKKIRADVDVRYFEPLYLSGGEKAITALVAEKFGERKKEAATELLRVGKLLSTAGHEGVEYSLAIAALQLDRSENVLRGAFWVTQRAQDFIQSCDIILELERLYGPKPSSKQRELLAKMQAAPAYMLSVLKAAAPQKADSIDSIPGRLCYVLHNTLPYSSGGYATRSHGVATGIKQAGWDVVVLSRPGFPLDIKPELTAEDVTPIDTVDGIPYVRTLAPLRAGMSAREYVLAAADAMEARLREYRPSVVIAASNHITALPALIAARRLGLPFIYEVRGMWEITRLSRDTAFGDSPAFHVQRMLEASVASMADHVFTLTEPMREELVERGVNYGHIDLLPNSCDPTRFEPVARDEALAAKLGIPAGVPVIGYIGTFVDYEGLENLAEACALLKERGIEFRLLMVGNENASGQTRGPITEEIVRVAETNGFSDWLILTGRVPHEEVEGYYSLVDIAPFPRKPLPVCEMVSPMKPLEALAMEKAVIVSSVRALVEMIQDGKTGLVFEKGNTESLAATLKRMIDSPELRAELGANGRKWVERERTWAQIGEKAGAILTRISGNMSKRVA